MYSNVLAKVNDWNFVILKIMTPRIGPAKPRMAPKIKLSFLNII
jgi:hypothetical protein